MHHSYSTETLINLMECEDVGTTPQETGEPLEMTYDLTYHVSHGPTSLTRTLEVRSTADLFVAPRKCGSRLGRKPHSRRCSPPKWSKKHLHAVAQGRQAGRRRILS
jgi:hypothetical protein